MEKYIAETLFHVAISDKIVYVEKKDGSLRQSITNVVTICGRRVHNFLCL